MSRNTRLLGFLGAEPTGLEPAKSFLENCNSRCDFAGCDAVSTRENGERGIRTLGALLGHGALAKLCFQPLSHLTKVSREYEMDGELVKRGAIL
jgi:hypothetical protein